MLPRSAAAAQADAALSVIMSEDPITSATTARQYFNDRILNPENA
jgi:hypothetical protein